MQHKRGVKWLVVILLVVPCWLKGFEDNPDPSKHSYLLVLLEKLEAGENVIFTKFGDGEYNCVIGEIGVNGVGDTYHPWLGESLKRSLIELSKKKNTYIGKWHTKNVYHYFDAIAKEHLVVIPWVQYHLILNDNVAFDYNHMHKFTEFVLNSKKKKILICNKTNARLKAFFSSVS